MKERKETEDQRDRHRELASEIRKLRRHDLERAVRVHVVENDVSEHVEATTTSTTGCLTVVEGSQVDRVSREDDSSAGHVDTHGQSSGGDNDREVSLAEENFDTALRLALWRAVDKRRNLHLAILAIHTGVMNAHTTSQSVDECRVGLAGIHGVQSVLEIGRAACRDRVF